MLLAYGPVNHSLIAAGAYLCSQLWFPTVQEVLHADWQEVWHSPHPPFFTVFCNLFVFNVLMCFIMKYSFLLFLDHKPGIPRILSLSEVYHTSPGNATEKSVLSGLSYRCLCLLAARKNQSTIEFSEFFEILVFFFAQPIVFCLYFIYNPNIK